MLITNYILIDFENVQPKDPSVFDAEHLKIIVFVGANQKKVPVELAKALQPFGSKAEYIQITSSGANVLDFHIAFYIGWLVASFISLQVRQVQAKPLLQLLLLQLLVSGGGFQTERNHQLEMC
jgi:hypothetical protein